MNLLYSNRSKEDISFITDVCEYVIKEPIAGKLDSDEFCGVFIDGRIRDVNCLEEYAALYSFKRFSRYNYPIYVFLANTDNFLDNNHALIKKWRITVVKIDENKSHDDYSKFCLEKLYFLLPKEIKRVITLQADGFLIKEGWESYILDNNWTYIGSPWLHRPSIEYFKDNKWQPLLAPVGIGNGGFSYRDVDLCKNICNYYKNIKTRERHTEDKMPPEDLVFSVFNNIVGMLPSKEQASKFTIDPMDREDFENKTSYGFHYFSAKNPWKQKI